MTQEITKVWLNTWGNYNEGRLGYGWKTPDEALEFIEDNPERDGGEWFIADIDDYMGIDLPNLEYRNVTEVLELLQSLEDRGEFERDCLIAVMHANNCFDIEEAERIAEDASFFEDWDAYHDYCDETLDFGNAPDFVQRYFDFDAFHRDCDFDATEAENGIVYIH